MDILRNDYVAKIAAKSWNGKVKIITGIRRCGKSYLLSHLYKQYLLQQGVQADCFVEIDLEPKSNIAYRNPNTLYEYIMGDAKTKNGSTMCSSTRYSFAPRLRIRTSMPRWCRRKISTCCTPHSMMC